MKCYHCGEECDPEHTYKATVGGMEQHFCCNGCLSACLIIYGAGEQSYYDKRTAPAPRLFPSDSDTDLALITAPSRRVKLNSAFDADSVMKAYTEERPDGLRKILLTIEGIHCASCVFLNERILSRTRGIHEAIVNYETGRATVLFDPQTIRISQIIQTVQSIGYDAVPMLPGQKSDRMKQEGKLLLWKLVVAGFFAGNIMLISMALWFSFFDKSLNPVLKEFFHWVEFVLATPVYLYSANVFHRGWKSFVRSGLVGMDLLISVGLSVAYFYSVHVVFSHQGEVYFDSVATISFFLLLGRYFEWKAKFSQRLRMEALIKPLPVHCMRVIPDERRMNGDATEVISVNDLERGDRVLLEAGGIVPADGILLTEICELDESVLTGENMPVIRKEGSRLLAGSRLVSGRIEYRVDSLPAESSLSVLSRLADSAGVHQSDIEKVTLRIIPWFSAFVLLISLGSFLAWRFLAGASMDTAVLAAISVLIISCPCALALSVPTAVGSAIYVGLRNGILIRDGGVLESLKKVKSYFFDKTGTLTRGTPSVHSHLMEEEVSLIRGILVRMEEGSPHPVGRAILEFARALPASDGGDSSRAQGYLSGSSIEEIPGRGMIAHPEKGGDVYRLGNLAFLKEAGVHFSEKTMDFLSKNRDATIVGLARDSRGIAFFALMDTPEENAAEVVRFLRSRGARVGMLTGDNESSARHMARQMGIDEGEVLAGLLPEDKERRIQERIATGQRVCMVGDGYNDAIALSRSSVSAVLARGAPLSMEHAGLILLQNDLKGLLDASRLSRRTMHTIYLNLGFSLLYNLTMIPVAASGYLLPVYCSLFMSLSSLTVVGTSILLRLRGI